MCMQLPKRYRTHRRPARDFASCSSGKGEVRSPGAFTVLLLGVDQRPGDKGRSDTIMVATVNPNSGKALLFNIPRDTRTRLVKRGYDDKINHAYAYDGIAGSVATVENFLDAFPIDYYVQVNMEGFEMIVDQLGGVDVNNSFTFDIDGFHFPKGPQHLDGEYALKYARMRVRRSSRRLRTERTAASGDQGSVPQGRAMG